MDEDRKKKRILAIILLFVFFFAGNKLSDMVVAQRAAKAEGEYPMSRDVYLLDTYCSITTYAGGGQKALEAAVEALNGYDDTMNYAKLGSDIYNINNRDMDRVEISDDTAEMLTIMRELCIETGGVLEPAIRPVTELWDFKFEKKLPEAAAINEALAKVRSLEWDIEGNQFVAYDDDVRIDVGAIAKGYIADRIKEVMVDEGVTSGIINLGGNVLCIGERPDGTPFSVAVRDPGAEEGYSEVLEINDISAVTAGAYERCFVEDGVRYHHILDPKTGYSARTGLESVTVTGPVSALCDGLSTSIFIMGEAEGTRFLEQYNENHGTDYRAYFLAEEEVSLDEDGNLIYTAAASDAEDAGPQAAGSAQAADSLTVGSDDDLPAAADAGSLTADGETSDKDEAADTEDMDAAAEMAADK